MQIMPLHGSVFDDNQHTYEIVGYALGSRMTKGLCMVALSLALAHKKPAAGLTLHSDRGSQYCSHDYQAQLIKAELVPSISRKGNCYDNAPMESFWGSLKNELVHHKRYLTRKQAADDITEYIEIFYNRMRRHTRLGNVSPAQFYQQFEQNLVLASEPLLSTFIDRGQSDDVSVFESGCG